MRILHIDTGRGWRGGQQQVLWLVEGARQHGLDQVLMLPQDSELARRIALPVADATPRLESVPLASSGVSLAKSSSRSRLRSPTPSKILTLGNVKRVRDAAGRIDVIHAHDAHAHTLAWAAQKMSPGKFPPVVVARRVTFPIRLLGRLKNRQPAWFVAVSEFIREQLIASGIPSERVRVIYDGVRIPSELPGPDERMSARRDLGVADGDFVLGTLSSFSAEKLLEETIQLVGMMPLNARFILGVPAAQATSAEASGLKRLATESGLGARFQVFGVESSAAQFLDALDVFVYLSRSEGLGSAILLAMAHGLPVVASRVGGIPEIVQHERTGLLVEPDANGWSKPLCSAVLKLMESAPLRARFGTLGHQFVEEHGSSDKMVARTVALYEEILASGGEKIRQ